MKQTFLILSIFVKSQSNNSFIAEDSKLIWQKVYETSLTFDEIYKAMNESGQFTDLQILDNKITGQTKPFKIDWASQGLKRMSTPMYINYYDYVGFLIVDFKDSKYRATLKTITMQRNDNIQKGMVKEKDILDEYALKKGQIRASFKDTEGKIFEYTINKLFTFKKAENW